MKKKPIEQPEPLTNNVGSIKEVLTHLLFSAKQRSDFIRSRNHSMVVTKIEEALLWEENNYDN